MKKNKKIGFTILAVIAIILLVLFLLGIYAKQKLKKSIDEDFSEILKYEELDVSLINRRIDFVNPEIFIRQNTISAEEISIEGINFYQYLVNNKLRVGNVQITNPDVILSNEEEEEEKSQGEEQKEEFGEDIIIRALNVTNGKVRMVEKDTSGNKLFLTLENFRIADLAINAKSVEERIPFKYRSYSFEVDSLKMELDERHDFSTGKFTGDNDQFSINELYILPKYDKVEFQQHIPYEKDRFDLYIENVSLENFTWGFENDSLRLNNDLLTIDGADLEVYRNKLVRDDPRTKTLYSEKIRNLPVKIDIKKIRVENSKIVYQEKIKESRPPGEVSFHALGAEIENLTNVGMNTEDFPKTIIAANALFYNETPLEVDWEFDINNETDAFTISGNLESVSANAINSFLRPAMNVEARGGIESLYFTYEGNDDKAQGDVRIMYRDFKVNVLEDDGTEKSSFWSSLANLFITNDAVNDDVNNQDLEVTRNKKKSFWNYLWLMVREGALASFI